MKARFKTTIAAVLLIPLAGRSQQVQSRAASIQSVVSILSGRGATVPGIHCMKSGTPLIALAHLHWKQLSAQSKATITKAFQVTDMQKSRLSPSGRFRIHYDTTGIDAPALLDQSQSARLPNTVEAYIDSVGAIFDYCWTFQIDSLGYAPPASDGGWGGGPEYDVFVQDLDNSTFGYTVYDDTTRVNPLGNPPRYWAYTVVDNDFVEYRTRGMDALRATAAHEFQHAVHLGGYGLWDSRDVYFFELTAGWMEGVNFPAVHDYYFDVSEYFSSFHGLPLYYFDSFYVGSERGIWGQYLAKRFGRDVVKDIWVREASEPLIPAINDALATRGSNLAAEFTLFSYWNYFTADRADTVLYYTEGRHYPRFTPSVTTVYSTGGNATIADQPHALSTDFYEFRLPADTITALIANIDVQSAAQYDFSTHPMQLELGKSVNDMATQTLPDGLKIGFSASDISVWTEHYLQSSTGSAVPNTNKNASPNPMLLSRDAHLALPVDDPVNARADVYFLSSASTLQFSGTYAVTNGLTGEYIFVPSSDLQSHLSSGIYFVIARVNQSEYHWKVAVIR